ncbi:MAG: hypothetical protein ACLQDY_08355 [Streptosporangiaceae bacterium]
MTGAELAARITAAEAARDGFRREVDAHLDEGGPRPDYVQWAWSLLTRLDLLLDGLELGSAAAPGPEHGPGLEHDETERRWLRTRLLAVLPVPAEPGDVNDAVAVALVAMPGDVAEVVIGWLSRAAGGAR